ncbi:hypothetical protein D3C76_1602490 [compost metagenome]
MRRLTQERGAQASIGRIGLILTVTGGTHGPDSVRLALQKACQARVSAIVERQRGRHRLPSQRRQTQAAAFGMRDETTFARFQPRRELSG